LLVKEDPIAERSRRLETTTSALWQSIDQVLVAIKALGLFSLRCLY